MYIYHRVLYERIPLEWAIHFCTIYTNKFGDAQNPNRRLFDFFNIQQIPLLHLAPTLGHLRATTIKISGLLEHLYNGIRNHAYFSPLFIILVNTSDPFIQVWICVQWCLCVYSVLLCDICVVYISADRWVFELFILSSGACKFW